MKRIVYKWNDVGVIFFPAGKISKKGTCEFATTKCIKNCPEIPNVAQPHFDTYDFIIGNKPLIVSTKITREMSEISVTILTWFASGDCMVKDEKHILDIIKRLSLIGIIQHGFTRNIEFWKKVQDIKNVYFALTVETEKEKDKYVNLGLVVIPDYKKDLIILYKMEEHDLIKTIKTIGSCGGAFYDDEKVGTEMRESNCQICYERMGGCFRK